MHRTIDGSTAPSRPGNDGYHSDGSIDPDDPSGKLLQGRRTRRVVAHSKVFEESVPDDVTVAEAWSFIRNWCQMSLDQIPIVQWLPKYTGQTAFSDVMAGLSVGVLLIPQSMAYAVLAGLPPIYGLYSSTIPLFVYALLASSTKVAPGPVAPPSILINQIVTSLGPATEADRIQLTIALSFVSGIVLVVCGALRLGFVANLLSWPVMSGFVSAAAFIIVASQLRDFLGIDMDGGDQFYDNVYIVFANLGKAHGLTAIVGICALVVLVGFKYIHLCGLWPCGEPGKPPPKWFPIQLIVVGLCIGLSVAVGFKDEGVTVVGDIPAGFPAAGFPLKSMGQFWELLPQSAVLALIAYVGSISLALSFAKEANEEVSANIELVALGAASTVGSFFSAYPPSGSFTRTAVNAEIGAKTPMAVIITGLMMVLVVLAVAPAFEQLPKTVLAAMVLASTQSLVKWKDAMLLWRVSHMDFAQFMFTFVVTLLTGIDNGIIISVAFSLVLLIYRSFQPRITELGRLPGTDVFVHAQRYPQTHRVPGVVVLRVDGELNFGNVKVVSKHLMRLLGARLQEVVRAEELEEAAAQEQAAGAVDAGAAGGSVCCGGGEAAAVVKPSSSSSSLEASSGGQGGAHLAGDGAEAKGSEDASGVGVEGLGNKAGDRSRASSRASGAGEYKYKKRVRVKTGEDQAGGSAPPGIDLEAGQAGARQDAPSRDDDDDVAAAIVSEGIQARRRRGKGAGVDMAEIDGPQVAKGAGMVPLPSAGGPGLEGGEEEHQEVLRAVVVDGCRINTIDTSACQELDSTIKVFRKCGVRLYFAALPGPVRDVFERFGIKQAMGAGAGRGEGSEGGAPPQSQGQGQGQGQGTIGAAEGGAASAAAAVAPTDITHAPPGEQQEEAESKGEAGEQEADEDSVVRAAVSQRGLDGDGAVFLTVTAAIDAVIGRSIAWKQASIFRGAYCDRSYSARGEVLGRLVSGSVSSPGNNGGGDGPAGRFTVGAGSADGGPRLASAMSTGGVSLRLDDETGLEVGTGELGDGGAAGAAGADGFPAGTGPASPASGSGSQSQLALGTGPAAAAIRQERAASAESAKFAAELVGAAVLAQDAAAADARQEAAAEVQRARSRRARASSQLGEDAGESEQADEKQE